MFALSSFTTRTILETCYATYTAYDGKMILPQFLETSDFLRFRFITLNGQAVEDKGMALFPPKSQRPLRDASPAGRGEYLPDVLDHLHFSDTMRLILRTQFRRRLVQLGNCGSPIEETEAGWLVISHGVGPMRKFCIEHFLARS